MGTPTDEGRLVESCEPSRPCRSHEGAASNSRCSREMISGNMCLYQWDSLFSPTCLVLLWIRLRGNIWVQKSLTHLQLSKISPCQEHVCTAGVGKHCPPRYGHVASRLQLGRCMSCHQGREKGLQPRRLRAALVRVLRANSSIVMGCIAVTCRTCTDGAPVSPELRLMLLAASANTYIPSVGMKWPGISLPLSSGRDLLPWKSTDVELMKAVKCATMEERAG